MIENESLDMTLFGLMEVYRLQVTDLKERLQNSERDRQYAESNYEPERKRANDLRGRLKVSEARASDTRATITEQAAKITKLESVIESLKIELQDARAEATEAKETTND